MHALLNGDPLLALDHNLLLLVVLPLSIWMWAGWLVRSWRGVTPQVSVVGQRRRNLVAIAVLVVALTFGVVRNFVPYLGSAA